MRNIENLTLSGLKKEMGHIANKSGFKKGLLKQLSKQYEVETNPVIKTQIKEECEELRVQIKQLKTDYELIKTRIKELKSSEMESNGSQMQ